MPTGSCQRKRTGYPKRQGTPATRCRRGAAKEAHRLPETAGTPATRCRQESCQGEAQATRNDRERRPHDANRETAKGGTGHSRPQAETDVTAAGDSSEAELPPAVATAAKACGPRGPHRQAVGRKRDATEGDGHPAQAADTERLQTTKPKLIISYGKKTK